MAHFLGTLLDFVKSTGSMRQMYQYDSGLKPSVEAFLESCETLAGMLESRGVEPTHPPRSGKISRDTFLWWTENMRVLKPEDVTNQDRYLGWARLNDRELSIPMANVFNNWVGIRSYLNARRT